MRRASIVGPLLLIGIGGLFLARNLVPDLPLLDYLARYWPFLLIGWGALRFLEVVLWWATDKPIPSAGVSGGEWSLIIFLCLFGFGLHAARGFSNWLPASGIEWGGLEVFGETYEYQITGEAAASKTPRVVIESFRGNARITGSDVERVTVTGRSTVRAIDQASADRANQDSQLEVSGSGNEISIRAHQDRSGDNRRVTADLEITVPRGASIVAHGRDGDFDISGITGTVDIDSQRASVRLEKIAGEVRLDLQSSDIIRAVDLGGNIDVKGRGTDIDLERIAGQVTVNGAYTGLAQFRALAMPVRWTGTYTEFTMQGLPGELRMSLSDLNASGVTGPMRINSRSKDIWLSEISDGIDVSLDRGDVVIEDGRTPVPRMNVRVSAGNVELALPANAGFMLNATTDRGQAENDYGSSIDEDNDGRRAVLRGNTGAGPAIDVNVGRGRLVLRRAGEILPPVAPGTPSPKPSTMPQPVEQ